MLKLDVGESAVALVTFNLPDTRAQVRIVWHVTTAGTEPANSDPIPSVISRRTVFVSVVSGEGTLTLHGGYYIPESSALIYWDTVFSQSVSEDTTIFQTLTMPYHFYRVQFTPASGYSGSIDIWVSIEGVA